MKRFFPSLFLGGLSALLFFWGLHYSLDLKASYLPGDLFRTETPLTFRVWFLETVISIAGAPFPFEHQGQEKPEVDTQKQREVFLAEIGGQVSERVAKRLLLMPIGPRRVLASAIVMPSYLKLFAKTEEERRLYRDWLFLGFEKALREAPLRGELWLALCVLKTQKIGFSEESARYLARSEETAPKEPFISQDRLRKCQ